MSISPNPPDEPFEAKRSSDKTGFAAWWGRWGRDFFTFLAVAGSTYSVIVTQSHVNNVSDAQKATTKAVISIAHESAERRDQTCLLFEGNEQKDIDQLQRTYDYLKPLTRKQLLNKESINPTILASLPQAIREAENLDAPAYCNEPNVGIAEPKPGTKIIPDPPKNIRPFLPRP